MAANWRDIADSEVDPESPVTTSLAQALRDNPEGIAAGVSGAPPIQDAAIASHPFSQADLNTAIGSVSVSSDNGTIGEAERILPSGEYGFAPQIELTTGGSVLEAAALYGFLGGSDWFYNDTTTSRTFKLNRRESNGNGETYGYDLRVYLYLQQPGSNTKTLSAKQRYIQASPPYDLGDGECGLFVEAEMLPDGSISGLYIAPDPIWANNGPTQIRPDWKDPDNGKSYKRTLRPDLTKGDLYAGRCDLHEYAAAQREARIEWQEVTPKLKNADMHRIPCSWASQPKGQIVMLDPVETHEMLELHEAGEDIGSLIHDGYIKLGKEVSRYGPPGVPIHTFRFK